MALKHICFDLDGTLVNSFPTIYKCTIRTLRQFNITDPVEEELFHGMIGHHFIDIFRELNVTVANVDAFINTYKTFYFDYIDDSLLYPAVEDVLKQLKSLDIQVSLLTTKGQDQADSLIDHFNLRNYFSAVYGRRNGMAIKPSAEPLLKICADLNVSPAETMMVGDSELDIRCGKNAGAKTCGVTYGYRKEASLKKETPDYLINTLAELPGIL
jgi:phosphoglycolate phosphatase